MDTTTLNTIVTIVGIIVGAGALFRFFRTQATRNTTLVESLSNTKESIEKGRQIKLAILEDFPDHKRLFDELRPYMISKRGIDTAMREYEQWHKTIREAGDQSPLNILGADHASEISETLSHLENLIEKLNPNQRLHPIASFLAHGDP